MAEDDKSKQSSGDEEGEDEGSVPKNGEDSSVKEDQKPLTTK